MAPKFLAFPPATMSLLLNRGGLVTALTKGPLCGLWVGTQLGEQDFGTVALGILF